MRDIKRYMGIVLSCQLVMVNSILVMPLYAEEISGNKYRVSGASFLSGVGMVIGPSQQGLGVTVGDSAASFSVSVGEKQELYAGHIYVIMLAFPNLGVRAISNLKARTDILGDSIAASTWQKDSDPYFYWNILWQPPELVVGCSVALDTLPDHTIDVTKPYYQFPERSIRSGRHTFYVRAFSSDDTPEENSLLEFPLWVDTQFPVMSDISPAPGEIIAESRPHIRGMFADEDSGVDLVATSLIINDYAVEFSYDFQKQLLEYRPEAAFPDGKISVAVKAVDAVGNSVFKAWDFLVDTHPPEGSILVNSGSETTHSAYVSLAIDVADLTTQVKNIYISNDGVFDTELAHPYVYAPVIYEWLLGQPDVDGSKTVYVKFQDLAGNLSEVRKDDIVLRLLTPNTRITSGPPIVSAETSADFTFEASKPGCIFTYRIDNTAWSEWSVVNEAHCVDLSAGNHYFYVKSGLDLNNDGTITLDEEDATPAQWVWSVGETASTRKAKDRILFWKR
ncbi:MAG: hypothetical protein KKC84_05575 [Candidatus Omnitrophica bacterium]|nr:hypothetical protein [Candidatus Omnitrophota bacterium]